MCRTRRKAIGVAFTSSWHEGIESRAQAKLIMPEMRRKLFDAPGILLLGVVLPGGLFLEFPIG